MDAAPVSKAELRGEAAVLSSLLDASPDLLVYTRESAQYEALRSCWNQAVAARPLAIVRPRTHVAVAAVVAWCGEHGLPLSVRSRGHDIHGRQLVGDGVVVDMRAMADVHVSADRSVARVGGGVLGGALQQFLDAQDLFTPTAWVESVRYCAWACGGGYGSYTARYGFGADQVVGAQVVAADGRCIDTDDDAELLWALRGAGCGNLGVVAELRVRLYPRPKLRAGLVGLPLAAPTFARLDRLFAAGLPRELQGDCNVINVPGVGGCLAVQFTWVTARGDLSEADAYLDKIIGDDQAFMNTVEETTPYRFCASLNPLIPAAPCLACGVAVASFGPDLARLLVDSPPAGAHSSVVIHNALRTPAAADTSFAHRAPHIQLAINGSGGPDSDPKGPGAQAGMTWAVGLDREIRDAGLALDKTYGSVSPSDAVPLVPTFGAAGAARLRAVKQRVDPDNVFSRGWPVFG